MVIYVVFWLGLVTGPSEINWEGLHTLNKKKKEKETDQWAKEDTNKVCKKAYII